MYDHARIKISFVSFLRKKSIASFNAIHAIRISTKISYNPQIIKSLVYTLEKQAFDFDTRRSRRGNLDQGEGEGKKGHARSTGVVVLAPTWTTRWQSLGPVIGRNNERSPPPLFPAVSIQFEPENRRLAVSRDAIYPSTRLLDTIDNLSLSLSLSFAAVSRPCLNFPMNDDASSGTSWSTFAPRRTVELKSLWNIV